MTHQAHGTIPVRVVVDAQQQTRIWVAGVELTKHCRVIRVEAREGAIPSAWLNLIGITLDVEADVPQDYVKEMTLDEDEANQEARSSRDVDRGKRTPRAILDVSLGTVKP